MKKILLSILLIFIIGCKKNNTFQELPCEFFFIEDKNDFTKKIIYKGKDITLTDSNDKIFGFFNFYSFDLKTYNIMLVVTTNICIHENTTVTFLFDDDSTTDYFVKSEENCSGQILLNSIYTNEFINKSLKAFRVKSFDEIEEFYLSENSILELRKMSSCFFSIAFNERKNKNS